MGLIDRNEEADISYFKTLNELLNVVTLGDLYSADLALMFKSFTVLLKSSASCRSFFHFPSSVDRPLLLDIGESRELLVSACWYWI